jgi:hypothetical protein
MSVTWDDTPGATASLSVTFSGCKSSDDNSKNPTWSALILSVKDQTWDAYTTAIAVDFCSPKNVTIIMPRMYVQGTGDIGQPPHQEVRYRWTLPAGWAVAGNGPLETDLNQITIYPTNCALPGQVQVQGSLTNRCGSAGLSSSAIISLNGITPAVTFSPPSSTGGTTACDTRPVTFTAATNYPFSCLTGYTWSIPSGWSINNQTANTITLTPNGLNGGTVQPTAKFSCGSTYSAGVYTVPFTSPSISSSSSPICSTAQLSLVNAPYATVSSWSSSNSSVLTINQSGLATKVGNASQPVTISATVACGVSVTPLSVSVGSAYFNSMKLDGVQRQWYANCSAGSIPYTASNLHVLDAYVSGSSSATFTLNDPSGSVSGFTSSPTQYSFTAKRSDANFSITVSTSNSCGGTTQCIYFSNGSSCPTTQFALNGAPIYPGADCSIGNNSFATGNSTLTVLTPSTSTTFSLTVFSGSGVSGTTVSPTQFSFNARNSAVQFIIMLSTATSCGIVNSCLFFCNGCANPFRVLPTQKDFGASTFRGVLLTTQTAISAFPNPASSTLTVQVADSLAAGLNTDKLDESYELYLMDKLQRTIISIHSTDKILQIPTENLPADTYYLQLHYKDAIIRKQIMIIR